MSFRMRPATRMNDLRSSDLIVGRITIRLQKTFELSQKLFRSIPSSAQTEVEHHRSSRSAILPQIGLMILPAALGETRPHSTAQSAGGFSISQKSRAGLSNSSPSNHEIPSTAEITSAILACLLRPLEIISPVTRVSFSSRSPTMTPHPCALTTTDCRTESHDSFSSLFTT